jgi:hypothetical protein
MGFQPINVPIFNTGLEKDLPGYLIPDDAMPELKNAYIWRKRVKKKYGSTLLGRLQNQVLAEAVGALGATHYTYTLLNIPAAPSFITITSGVQVITDDGQGNLIGDIDPLGTNTINYETGDIDVTFLNVTAAAVTVSYDYYLRLPVMGIFLLETNNINDENVIAFDTEKSYLWNESNERFENITYLTSGAAFSWSANNYNFFWGLNYYTDTNNNRLFWVVNNSVADGIRYFNGSTTNGWTVFRPTTSTVANNFLDTARMVISYKDRLIFLNTTETVNGVSTNLYQRARWSQNGSPLSADAFNSNVVGKGGYIDAPTSEQIISCAFYKDILIVFFERSTWQLVYTGNEVLPFIWQRINSQYGSESTFSSISFDEGIQTVGDKAIVLAETTNVNRMDLKIPDEVFEIDNSNFAVERIHGVRDYYTELSMWTTVTEENLNVFPDRILVLNYRDGAYSYFDVSATCFGQFQWQSDLIWSKATKTWEEYDGKTWNSFRTNEKQPLILYGNQQGYVSIINFPTNTNDPSLYITNITQAFPAVITSPDHNLKKGTFVKFKDVVGMSEINDTVGMITNLTIDTITVDIDTRTFTAFSGYGQMSIVDNFSIKTKRFNPFYQLSKMIRINYFDTYVESYENGEITIDVIKDDSSVAITSNAVSLQNINTLFNNEKVWQRLYLNVRGQFLQFYFHLSDEQMRDGNSPYNTFILYNMRIWGMPIGRLFSYDRIT